MAIFSDECISEYFSRVQRDIKKKIESFSPDEIIDLKESKIRVLAESFSLEKLQIDYGSATHEEPIDAEKITDDVDLYSICPLRPFGGQKTIGFSIKFYVPVVEGGMYLRYYPSNNSFLPFCASDEKYKEIKFTRKRDAYYLVFDLFISKNTLKSNKLDEKILEQFNSQLISTKEIEKELNKNISSFNENLYSFISHEINENKAKLTYKNKLTQALKISFKSKNEYQEKGKKIELKPKQLDLGLPKRKETNGFYIDENDYRSILNTIRFHLRSTEENPKAIIKLNSEELIRDTILWALNSNYFVASGETFRRSGKADILIIFSDRSAFIAECKIWNGKSIIQGTIDQLLSYSTWRDSKMAVIIFNLKNSDFHNVCENGIEAVKNHHNFLKVIEGKDNELICEFKDENNTNSSITIAFFFANYVSRTN